MSIPSLRDLKIKHSGLREAMHAAGVQIPLDNYFAEQDRVVVYAALVDYVLGELRQIAAMKDGTASAIAQEAAEHILAMAPV